MYRITKLDKNLTTPNGETIPGPTKADRKWVREFEWDNWMLVESCENGNLWQLQFALRRDYNFYDCVDDCIYMAIENNHVDILKLFEENGHKLGEYLNCEDMISHAAKHKSKETFQYLMHLFDADVPEMLEGLYQSQANPIRLMISETGGIWKKATPMSINHFEYHETMRHDVLREIATTFNFQARKVITTIREDDIFAGMTEQNFQNLENQDQIIEAYNQLSRKNSDLPPVSQYVTHAPKPASVNWPVRRQFQKPA